MHNRGAIGEAVKNGPEDVVGGKLARNAQGSQVSLWRLESRMLMNRGTSRKSAREHWPSTGAIGPCGLGWKPLKQTPFGA